MNNMYEKIMSGPKSRSFLIIRCFLESARLCQDFRANCFFDPVPASCYTSDPQGSTRARTHARLFSNLNNHRYVVRTNTSQLVNFTTIFLVNLVGGSMSRQRREIAKSSHRRKRGEKKSGLTDRAYFYLGSNV